MEIICKHCGKPLKKIRDLTEDELKNILYLDAKETALWKVASTLISQPLNRKIKKEYVRVFKLISKIKLLRVQLDRDILGDTNGNIIDGGIYIHEDI